MKKLFSTCILLCLSAFGLFSQSADSYNFYMSKADHNAVLFRGPIAKPLNFVFQGTYFAYSDVFTQGDVFFNGKLYHDVWLNLDASTDELYVRHSKDSQTLNLDKDLVKYFVMNGHRFVNIKGEKVSDGYYEVLYDGLSDLIKKNTKKLYEEENLTKVKIFEDNNRYYILKDGIYYPVKGKKSFISCFKERKKEIGKTSRTLSTAQKDKKDTYYITLISKGCNQ